MIAQFVSSLVLAATSAIGPCDLVKRSEVVATLHWTVSAVHESTYRLPQARGALCRYEADEGTVLVTMPERGSSFFNNNDLVDPFRNGMGHRVAGLGASVQIFDNAAYIAKSGRSVSIAVLPVHGEADEPSLTRLVRFAVRRMR